MSCVRVAEFRSTDETWHNLLQLLIFPVSSLDVPRGVGTRFFKPFFHMGGSMFIILAEIIYFEELRVYSETIVR
jgi:hypothetical protein